MFLVDLGPSIQSRPEIETSENQAAFLLLDATNGRMYC